MSYTSKLPQIAAQLGARMDAVAKVTAERIEARAKERAPVSTGRLRDAIHVERTGVGEYQVIAGDTTVFYAHIVEHGGARTGPRPFMTPALEETRPDVETLGREALEGL